MTPSPAHATKVKHGLRRHVARESLTALETFPIILRTEGAGMATPSAAKRPCICSACRMAASERLSSTEGLAIFFGWGGGGSSFGPGCSPVLMAAAFGSSASWRASARGPRAGEQREGQQAADLALESQVTLKLAFQMLELGSQSQHLVNGESESEVNGASTAVERDKTPSPSCHFTHSTRLC